MSRIRTTVVMLLLATMAFGQAKEDAGDGKMLDKQTMEFKDYLPEIHGTIRGKYEYQTETSESRFEVRNARFSVSGNVHPIVAYKAEIDLSDEGSIKMLDAYARVFPVKDLNFTIGQMRVPFTIDAHRSPHQQYFANRSFIAKQVGNVRDPRHESPDENRASAARPAGHPGRPRCVEPQCPRVQLRPAG